MPTPLYMYKVIERRNRLDFGTDNIVLSPFTEGHVTSPFALLRPLVSKKAIVDDNSFRYAINVLEESKNKKFIATFINNNISYGIANVDNAYGILESSNLDKSVVKIVEETLDNIEVCDRIYSNYAKMSKRFNFDSLAKSVGYNKKSTMPIIQEMCTLIDTYDISPNAKYNIALECINYAFFRNNINVSVTAVAEGVTDYFLTRDAEIPDAVYAQYQSTLSNHPIYEGVDLSEYPLTNTFLANSHDEYTKRLLEYCKYTKDASILELVKTVPRIRTERDAATHIENINDYLTVSDDISDTERGVLYKAIDYIPKITKIPNTFVDIQKNKFINKADYDKCINTIDGVMSDDQAIQDAKLEKEKFKSFMEDGTFAKSDDVKDLLKQFKADQDKSGGKFRSLVNKLFAKKPENIIDDLPSIFSIAKSTLVLGVAGASTAGPVIAGILVLANWIVSRKCTYNQTKAAITAFTNEEKAVKKKIEDCDDSAKKAELEKYLSNVTACKKKLVDYKATLISDEDPDAFDNGDDELQDINFDDFNFESASMNIDEDYIYEDSMFIINEKFDLTNVRLVLQGAKSKLKDLNTKQKQFWMTADATSSALANSMEKAMTSDRRENIIKGNIIPTFSKLCKSTFLLAGVGIVFGPFGALVAALGTFACNKALNAREKKLIMDEIDTELRVIEKEIEIAQNDQDMNQYRFLLNYQKKLVREQQRIRYGMKTKGRNIPASTPMLRNRN